MKPRMCTCHMHPQNAKNFPCYISATTRTILPIFGMRLDTEQLMGLHTSRVARGAGHVPRALPKI